MEKVLTMQIKMESMRANGSMVRPRVMARAQMQLETNILDNTTATKKMATELKCIIMAKNMKALFMRTIEMAMESITF